MAMLERQDKTPQRAGEAARVEDLLSAKETTPHTETHTSVKRRCLIVQ